MSNQERVPDYESPEATAFDRLTRQTPQEQAKYEQRPMPKATPYFLAYQGKQYEFFAQSIIERDEFDPVLDLVVPVTEVRGYTKPAVQVADAALLYHKDRYSARALAMKVLSYGYRDEAGFTQLHMQGYGSLMAQGPLHTFTGVTHPHDEDTVTTLLYPIL